MRKLISSNMGSFGKAFLLSLLSLLNVYFGAQKQSMFGFDFGAKSICDNEFVTG